MGKATSSPSHHEKQINTIGYSYAGVWPLAIFEGNYELAEFIYNHIRKSPIDFFFSLRLISLYFETFEAVVKQNRIDHIKVMDRDYKLNLRWERVQKYPLSQSVKSIGIVAKHGFVEGIDYFLTTYEYVDITFALRKAIEFRHLDVFRIICEKIPTSIWNFNEILQKAAFTGQREMVECLLDHGIPLYRYGRDIIRCNDIEIYKLLYLYRISEFKVEILHNILSNRVSLPLIEFMYENRSDKSVDPFRYYPVDLFYIIIEQDSFDKLQFFIKVRESVCYYTLIITAVRFKRSDMLRFIITSRNNENRKRYRNIETAERLQNRAISSLQQYGRCDTLVEEITNDILNVKLS
ncbi:hypothetical protein PPL_00876 [Heterostelium album PN500]|uniref:Ankyrin repeat protein n=1 Tax=Heterostelium pallidum (strain ATCC 26659 / Pp 5 / PN500) TaxID=670386 RepID=D3AYV7_HETP5|nr:hypothetical protein PPL_00876 [Heterostelium album PN500]EFA85647.1 hypothetical protein PPL_00876 [Heterostelium album PN500]|eukprot:XP_020437754.1 hypothetical protein PPL_00876 [Heterostelium album PN500]